MENGKFLGRDYFEHLLAEIRLSERRFYQKITDIYATSMDYDPDSPTTREFFAKIQNKLHYAVHRHTAAELIMERAMRLGSIWGWYHGKMRLTGKL